LPENRSKGRPSGPLRRISGKKLSLTLIRVFGGPENPEKSKFSNLMKIGF
jgi:hypothetical protein